LNEISQNHNNNDDLNNENEFNQNRSVMSNKFNTSFGARVSN